MRGLSCGLLAMPMLRRKYDLEVGATVACGRDFLLRSRVVMKFRLFRGMGVQQQCYSRQDRLVGRFFCMVCSGQQRSKVSLPCPSGKKEYIQYTNERLFYCFTKVYANMFRSRTLGNNALQYICEDESTSPSWPVN